MVFLIDRTLQPKTRSASVEQ